MRERNLAKKAKDAAHPKAVMIIRIVQEYGEVG